MFAEKSSDIASLLAILTSPGCVENAILLNGTWDTFGATIGRVDSSEVVNYLLVPCVTLGDTSVGVVLTRESQLPTNAGSESASCASTCTGDTEDTIADDTSAKAISAGMDPKIGHLHMQGRFYFSNETGDLLILQELMPHEHDCCSDAMYLMSAMLGVIVPDDSYLRTREVLRMVWLPGARNFDGTVRVGGKAVSEKLTINVDKAQYLAGNLEASIIAARCSPNATRMVCANCLTRKSRSPTMCNCSDWLLRPKTITDHSTAARNVNLSHRGHWLGDCDMYCNMPGVAGPGLSFRQKLSVDIGFADGANELCTQLRSLAIDRSVSTLSIPKQVMPPAGDILELESPSKASPNLDAVDAIDAYLCSSPRVEHGVSVDSADGLVAAEWISDDISVAPTGTCVFRSLPEFAPLSVQENGDVGCLEGSGGNSSVLGVSVCAGSETTPCQPTPAPDTSGSAATATPGTSEPAAAAAPDAASAIVTTTEVELTPQEARARARKKRAEDRIISNREAARRSNERRRLKNLELKESLKIEKRRAVELRTVEMSLRAQNVQLRMQYEVHRSTLASGVQK